MTVEDGENLDIWAVLLDPGRPYEQRSQRTAVEGSDVKVRLEALDLAAECVAPGHDVHHAEVIAVEHDQPSAGAQHGHPAAHELAHRLGEPLARHAEHHGR